MLAYNERLRLCGKKDAFQTAVNLARDLNVPSNQEGAKKDLVGFLEFYLKEVSDEVEKAFRQFR